MRWDMGIGKETAEQLKEQAETQQSQFQAGRESVAERERFEPSIEFPLYTLSKRAPSTTRPSLRGGQLCRGGQTAFSGYHAARSPIPVLPVRAARIHPAGPFTAAAPIELQ